MSVRLGSQLNLDLSDGDVMALKKMTEEAKDTDIKTLKGRYTNMLQDLMVKGDTMIGAQEKSHQYMRSAVKYGSIFVVVLALLCGANFGLTLHANEVSKEAHIVGRQMTDTDGQVVQVSSSDFSIGPNGEMMTGTTSGRRLGKSTAVGTTNHKPRVTGLQFNENPTRALTDDTATDAEDSGVLMMTIPYDDFQEAADAFMQGGMSEFTVDLPGVGVGVINTVIESVHVGEGFAGASGVTTSNSYVWEVACDAPAEGEPGTCAVMTTETETSAMRMLRDRAGGHRPGRQLTGGVGRALQAKKPESTATCESLDCQETCDCSSFGTDCGHTHINKNDCQPDGYCGVENMLVFGTVVHRCYCPTQHTLYTTCGR